MSEFKYIIKSKEYDGMYKHAKRSASYGSTISEAIHDKLPSWIPESGDPDHEVIRSDSKKFKKLVMKERENLYKDITRVSGELGRKRQQLENLNEALGDEGRSGIGAKMDAAFNNLGFVVTSVQGGD